MHPVDLAVHATAAIQCGYFNRRQALAAGATDALIGRRIASGRWLVVAPGVYRLPGHPRSFLGDVWRAWLAGPAEAVVTHWSAGAIRQLPGFPASRLTLTVPHGTSRRNPVAQVFQSVAPPVPEWIDGLPVASVERILFDVAPFVGGRMLLALVEEVRTAGRTNPVRLRREFVRLARSGRDGTTAMRAVVTHYEDGPVPPRSELERALDAILRGIPAVAIHEAPLPGQEWSEARVDRRFDAPRRLIVEGDGRRWHTRLADFRRDRQRDRAALRAGYPTVRYAYEELTDEPEAVRAELLALLGISESAALGNRELVTRESADTP